MSSGNGRSVALAEENFDRLYFSGLCRSVPSHVVEHVLRLPGKEVPEFEILEGSILFADLVGFTSLCERLAQEARGDLSTLSGLLNRLFTRLETEMCLPWRGSILEFAGDAVTVLFKGPGHALNAAAAALACKRIVRSIKTTSRQVGALDVRQGISSGRVRLAILGDLSRRLAVCSGPAVHRAIALQQLVGPGEIGVDAPTHRALAGSAQVKSKGRNIRLLHGLTREPVHLAPIETELSPKENFAEQIRFLEPFVLAPLIKRMRSAPGGWKLEPEIRDAVVLFVDLEGFSENSLNRNLASMISRSLLRAFHKYDGLVFKCAATATGHRAMVLFGVQRPSENDAEKALLSGLEAISRVKAFGPELQRPIRLKMGVHTGRVFFGAVGGKWKHDLTVLGDTVNVACRAATAALPFELRATDAVLAKVRGCFVSSSSGPLTLKGKKEKTVLHVIQRPEVDNAHYARRRSRTRFSAGRTNEELALAALSEKAFDQNGSLIGLCGERGTGKSHLLANLVDAWVDRGGLALVGRCRLPGRASPLAAVRGFLATFLELQPRGSETVWCSQVRERLAQIQPRMQSPELIALLQPVERADGVNENVLDFSDPDTETRLLDALVEVAEKRLGQAKVLYVLEDLQSADHLTQKLVARLSQISRQRPFLFIITYRPNAPSDLRRSVDHEFTLHPLDLSATRDLIGHAMSAKRVDSELVKHLFRRTAGNPSHLVHSIRFLEKRRVLVVDRLGVAKIAGGIHRLKNVLPPAWAHLALRTLEHLTETERHLARAAVVAGPQFSAQLLEKLTNLPTTLFHNTLDNLQSQGIFVRTESAPNHLEFGNESLSAMIHNMLPERERRSLVRRLRVLQPPTVATPPAKVQPRIRGPLRTQRPERLAASGRRTKKALTEVP